MSGRSASIDRREFVQRWAAVGLATGIDRLLPDYARLFHGPETLLATGGQRNIIDLQIGRRTLVIGDREASAAVINGSIPGPLVRMKEGETTCWRF